MPEDIGHFKVVLEAAVDSKVGDALEKEFEKTSKSVGKKLADSLGKSSKEAATDLQKKLEKAIEFTQKFHLKGLEKLAKAASEGAQAAEKETKKSKPTAYYSMTEKSHLQPLKGATIDTTKGAATGGGLAEKGGASKGMMGALGGMALKLTALIGVVSIVSSALMSLAPIQAILKLIGAVLQLTLYPIAQFLLTIFKPIIAILLKYLVLPFYYQGLPILTGIGKGIVDLVASIGGFLLEPLMAGMDLLGNIIGWISNLFEIELETIKKVVGIYFGGMKTIIETILSLIKNLITGNWQGVYDDLLKILTTMKNMIFGIFGALGEGILKILQSIPFIGDFFKGGGKTEDAQAASRDVMITTSARTKGSDVIQGWKGRMEGTKSYSEGDMITASRKGMEISQEDFIQKAIDQTISYLNLKDNYNIYVDGKLMQSVAGTQQTPVSAAPQVHQAPTADYYGNLLQQYQDRIAEFAKISSTASGINLGWGTETGPSIYGGKSIIGNTLDQYYGGAYSNLFNIQKYADGGIVNSPTIGLVGESGPEAIIPLSKMGNMGSKPNITINIAKIEKDVDVDALIKKIERELYTNMKRGGAR